MASGTSGAPAPSSSSGSMPNAQAIVSQAMANGSIPQQSGSGKQGAGTAQGPQGAYSPPQMMNPTDQSAHTSQAAPQTASPMQSSGMNPSQQSPWARTAQMAGQQLQQPSMGQGSGITWLSAQQGQPFSIPAPNYTTQQAPQPTMTVGTPQRSQAAMVPYSGGGNTGFTGSTAAPQMRRF